MKTINKIIPTLLLIFLVSCSKDEPKASAQIDNQVNTIVIIPKVKTFTIGTTIFTLIYDTQGRLITRASTDGNKDEYEYTPDKVKHRYLQGNVLQRTTMYDLNTDGLKIKSLVTFPSIGNYQTVYTYNANKQLATLVNSNSLDTKTSTTNFFYVGKNLDYLVQSFSYNQDTWRTNYTYYTDKINTFGNKNQGYLFDIQEQTENVPKTITTIFPSNTIVDTYTYEYDNLGRTIKRLINNVLQNEIVYY